MEGRKKGERNKKDQKEEERKRKKCNNLKFHQQ